MTQQNAGQTRASTRLTWPIVRRRSTPRCLTREDASQDYGEQRLISLGWLQSRVVVLVWTDRDDGPRLISCREANPHEQEAYFREYPKI